METANPGRRRFCARVIGIIQSAIGGSVAFVLGGAIVPPLRRQQSNWLAAASLSELLPDEPKAVMLRVTRDDGYAEVVTRQTVFLVKTSDAQVTALSSVCTHLGCRVAWDPEAQLLKCPCHGGVYDRTGAVIAGPPPAPLPTLPTRIDGDQILVEI